MARKSCPREDLHPRCVILGRLIKAERIKRRWSQGYLGKLVGGVSRQKMGQIENGEVAADSDLLCRLEDVLHLRVPDLWLRAFREEAGLVPA